MNKLMATIPLAGAVTFTLFALMSFLVKGHDEALIDDPNPVIVEVARLPDEIPAAKRPRVKLEPPKPPERPQQVPETIDSQSEPTDFTYQPPGLTIEKQAINPSFHGNGDREATPVVRVNPKYPAPAQRDGTEGWVKLIFDINEMGGVENVRVLDASPKRVFDKAARSALRKWKYQPKKVDGKMIKQHDLTVQLDFKMQQ
ncbi:energy transducer TonB [Thalassotalea agarivorans]|uniref:Protein TonB n=1 Tax=Thalassotalea agarivorans TaxID=349064 RepID=A0A1I0E1U5_THASX|nr:energy transducer TonB [Thalassotalea agarivorans]SET38864.1 protein TonB [Thalassotalea agarivorans]